MKNAQLLAKWLNARFYISRYIPVKVEEFLVFENAVYPASTSGRFYKTATQLNSQITSEAPPKPEQCRLIKPSEHSELANPLLNAVVALATETARAGYGALVFCSSRGGCETDALLFSQSMPKLDSIADDVIGKRKDLLGELRSTATGLDHTLEKTIPYGVGFHRKFLQQLVFAVIINLYQDAGLTSEEREIITGAYDAGALKVIVATCSLAAGINLPARRVILHGARQGRDFIGPSMLSEHRKLEFLYDSTNLAQASNEREGRS